MRNLFTYFGFNKENVLNILCNLSKKTDYISILVSNYNKKTSALPKDYINYDIIAGVGCIDLIHSNNNSFEKLNNFQLRKRDWLFGYLSYDLKNEIENLTDLNKDVFNLPNLYFYQPKVIWLIKEKKAGIYSLYEKNLKEDWDHVNSIDYKDCTEISSVDLIARTSKEEDVRKIKIQLLALKSSF